MVPLNLSIAPCNTSLAPPAERGEDELKPKEIRDGEIVDQTMTQQLVISFLSEEEEPLPWAYRSQYHPLYIWKKKSMFVISRSTLI